MERISSRHEGNLGGRLRPFDETDAVSVTLEIAEDVAGLAAVQHTAWMALNMLTRLSGIVMRIYLVCPRGIPLAGRVVPLAQRTLSLDEALFEGATAIATVPCEKVAPQRPEGFLLVIGPGGPVADGFRVHGEGWWGGVTSGAAIAPHSDSCLPYGPYLAASFAVGEVFKAARIDPRRYHRAQSVFYSLWTHRATASPDPAGPATVSGTRLSESLAGVGAVGCIAVHALWATPGLLGDVVLADSDKNGVDITNLNRYLLFGRASVGKPKASTAADIARDGDILWLPYDGNLESYLGPARRILCAVDTNTSRRAVQARWPASLLMASTEELRAELVRCDPRHGGPCARCFNDPVAAIPDDERRQRFLSMSTEEQRTFAESVGATVGDALEWAQTGRCSTSGDRVRDALLGPHNALEAWAVPFVSCAAGVMLAAEAVKETMDARTPLSPSVPRATVQFWRPEESSGAKPYLRDLGCPMCRPGTEAVTVWRERMAQTALRGNNR